MDDSWFTDLIQLYRDTLDAPHSEYKDGAISALEAVLEILGLEEVME